MNKRSKNAAKAETVDKVKEIKQRQQAWFKQREREKSETKNTSAIDQTPPTGKVPRTTRSPIEQPQQPPKRGPFVRKTQVISEGHGDRGQMLQNKTGFQTWLEARQTDSNNFIVRQGRDKSDEEFQDGPPLTEEMFDTAAERIASRVKMEMKLGERQDGDGDNSSSNLSEQFMGKSSGLDSHRCHLCNTVMVAPHHSPTLLIPCGHTYCMRCINHKTNCPGCNCPIQSMTNNITLEQIIMEYAKKSKNLKGSHLGSSSGRSTPIRPEKDYAAEYQQLDLRCEVLQAESEDIKNKMKDLDGQIHQQERQMQGIDRQESRLQAEIEEIQQKIYQLRDHKKHFEDQIRVIEGQKEDEADRLGMVQATISQLSEDMIKAKAMAKKLKQDINR